MNEQINAEWRAFKDDPSSAVKCVYPYNIMHPVEPSGIIDIIIVVILVLIVIGKSTE